MMHVEARPPLPIFQYIMFPQLLLSLVIAIRPKAGWRLAAFLLISCVYLKSISFTLGNKDINYILGVIFGGVIATALHLLLLSDPLNDFRHKNDLVPPRDLPLSRRVYWALCLQHAIRGIEWNYKVCIVHAGLIFM